MFQVVTVMDLWLFRSDQHSIPKSNLQYARILIQWIWSHEHEEKAKSI